MTDPTQPTPPEPEAEPTLPKLQPTQQTLDESLAKCLQEWSMANNAMPLIFAEGFRGGRIPVEYFLPSDWKFGITAVPNPTKE